VAKNYADVLNKRLSAMPEFGLVRACRPWHADRCHELRRALVAVGILVRNFPFDTRSTRLPRLASRGMSPIDRPPGAARRGPKVLIRVATKRKDNGIMPNYLEESLGTSGKLVEKLSQKKVVKAVHLKKGGCLAICAKWMCELSKINMPTLQESLEVAQWMHETGEPSQRLEMLTKSYGLTLVGTTKGMMMYDEISFGEFMRRSGNLPSFNMFGVDDTQRTEGHELLMYTWDNSTWCLLDPNFGIASWPHFSGMAVGLKKLLRTAYPGFGPYFPFDVMKYEWSKK
jgi:hypothetical protein